MHNVRIRKASLCNARVAVSIFLYLPAQAYALSSLQSWSVRKVSCSCWPCKCHGRGGKLLKQNRMHVYRHPGKADGRILQEQDHAALLNCTQVHCHTVQIVRFRTGMPSRVRIVANTNHLSLLPHNNPVYLFAHFPYDLPPERIPVCTMRCVVLCFCWL